MCKNIIQYVISFAMKNQTLQSNENISHVCHKLIFFLICQIFRQFKIDFVILKRVKIWVEFVKNLARQIETKTY
jgi:uncharacterized membrane protein